MRRKISTTVYFTKDQIEKLRDISEATEVPMAALIRRAVNDLIATIEKEMRK